MITTGYGVPLEDPVTTYEEPAVPASDSYGVIIIITIIPNIFIIISNIIITITIINVIIININIIISSQQSCTLMSSSGSNHCHNITRFKIIISRSPRQTPCLHQLDMDYHRWV